MKIAVLNGSPKGKNSTTMHTVLYLQALHPAHAFEFFMVGQQIKSYEKNFESLREKLEQADLILFTILCIFYCTLSNSSQNHETLEKQDCFSNVSKFARRKVGSMQFVQINSMM